MAGATTVRAALGVASAGALPSGATLDGFDALYAPVALDALDSLVGIDALDALAAGAPALVGGPLAVHGGVGPRQVVTGVLAAAIAILGIAIAVIAFQGYRRNRSRPMLFISVGFGLIILSQIAATAFVFVLGLDRYAVQTMAQLSQVLGLASILYGLRTNG